MVDIPVCMTVHDVFRLLDACRKSEKMVRCSDRSPHVRWDFTACLLRPLDPFFNFLNFIHVTGEATEKEIK